MKILHTGLNTDEYFFKTAEKMAEKKQELKHEGRITDSFMTLDGGYNYSFEFKRLRRLM